MLSRLIESDLEEWRQLPEREPVLLDGARQVGKTFLITKIFGPKWFRKVIHLDFREQPKLARLFAQGLAPETVLKNLATHLDSDIDPEQDLIFFDEVGECQPAVDSLKYFAERLPGAFVCASGSNLGLLDSFPVGKVHWLTLPPLCFEEFVMASGRDRLLAAFRERDRSPVVHDQLWELLLDYYFVGGMPGAVSHWFGTSGKIVARIRSVREIQRRLIDGFRNDFGKYAGRIHAQHIDAVFTDIPRQLAASRDGSVQRYRFRDVIEKKRRYADLQSPIDWLVAAQLAQKCHLISGRPQMPLLPQSKQNAFRLYLSDVGLLGHMLNLDYAAQHRQDTCFKGFVAENFVQNEIHTHVGRHTYGWQGTRAEIEFLHHGRRGDIIPVEVKSGARTRARSLRTYLEQYRPRCAVKLVGNVGGKGDGVIQTWPLYHAQFLHDL